MKKLTAIFLFTLFLFNFIGYRLMFYYAQQQSDVQLEAALDKDLYNEAELVTIKVPLSMPYLNEQSQFERVDGEVSFNGKIYKYVKRRISEGNLILLCVPDHNKMRLEKEKDDFFKDANSLAQNNGSKKQENSKGKSFKNLLSEFDQFHNKTTIPVFDEHISHTLSRYAASLTTMPHTSHEQPPELA